jgi:DNA-binding LacI/PurR family transcriptional regulator
MMDRDPKREITIYDIANEAGVSPATVSRVLTKSATVSPVKREAVERLIRKYKFRPNAMARRLSHTRTKILGLMVADIRNPYYAALAVECEKAANKRGYTVLLCNALSDAALEESNLEKLHEQRADAIIQIGCRADDLISDRHYVRHVNQISRTTPFVITGKLDGANCYRLNIDDARGMEIVIEHLISLGHREIALVGGSKQVKSTYDKWQQYLRLVAKHHLVLRDEYFLEGDYSDRSGYNCMNQLLSLDSIPSAVIAINDYSAVGVVKAAIEHGLSIPKDISVISFDNTFLSETLTPKLTTIDYDYVLFGQSLIDIAIDASTGNDIRREQYITPKLIIRESCGPARRKGRGSHTQQTQKGKDEK